QDVPKRRGADMVRRRPPLSHALREHLERLLNGYFHAQGSFYDCVLGRFECHALSPFCILPLQLSGKPPKPGPKDWQSDRGAARCPPGSIHKHGGYLRGDHTPSGLASVPASAVTPPGAIPANELRVRGRHEGGCPAFRR